MFSVVLKPVTGFGGQDMTLNVKSCIHIMRKLINNSEIGVIIQNQIEGHRYRILVNYIGLNAIIKTISLLAVR